MHLNIQNRSLDINLRSIQACVWTELFDRLGYDIRNISLKNSKLKRMHYVFESEDIIKKIASFLNPSKLSLLAQVSKYVSLVAKSDFLWMPWLIKLSNPQRDGDMFLLDSIEGCKAVSDRCHNTAFYLFAERAKSRRMIQRGWAELSRFVGLHSRLRTGLPEHKIRELEAAFCCHLPLQLRELYRLCDGEQEEWGTSQVGVMNGYRFLPLEEALALVAEARSVGGDTSVLQLTQLAGFGSAGDGYVVGLTTGNVIKVSGSSRVLVGDIHTFLNSISR